MIIFHFLVMESLWPQDHMTEQVKLSSMWKEIT